jgi:hypothetical protein
MPFSLRFRASSMQVMMSRSLISHCELSKQDSHPVSILGPNLNRNSVCERGQTHDLRFPRPRLEIPRDFPDVRIM